MSNSLNIQPCFCNNTDVNEFIIKVNKITCLCCNTTRVSSTSTTIEEMIAVWNARGITPTELSKVKADAIIEMLDEMPAIGFVTEREKNNWIGEYIENLKRN